MWRSTGRAATRAILGALIASGFASGNAFAQVIPSAQAASIPNASGLPRAADFYREKPLRLVVPFPAGGSSDFRARQLAKKLKERSGIDVIVENRPGASGFLGSELVAKAPADGHTVLLGTIGTLAINPSLFSKLPYQPLHDFVPVTQFSTGPVLLAAHPSLGVSNLRELIDLVRRQPGRFAYASTGNGTIQHILGETFKRAAGVQLIHIPYRGTAPAVQDFVAGHVGLMFDTPTALAAHIQAGRAVPIALTSAKRVASMPNVATFIESGVDDFVYESWQGIVAPKGLPPPVLAMLAEEIRAALQDAEIVASHREQASEVVANSPQEFARHIERETARWAKAVRESGAQID